MCIYIYICMYVCIYIHWMVSGDKNSSYFHNRASQLYRRNNISELQDSHARLVSGDENISVMIVDYYKQLFTSSKRLEFHVFFF